MHGRSTWSTPALVGSAGKADTTPETEPSPRPLENRQREIMNRCPVLPEPFAVPWAQSPCRHRAAPAPRLWRPLARAIAVLVMALATVAPKDQPAAERSGPDVSFHARPIDLDPDRPRDRRVGKLMFRGGIAISSSDRRFGGLSSLLIADGGKRFLATSDRGYWIDGELTYDAEGDLIGVRDIGIRTFVVPLNRLGKMSPWRDAEALTPLGRLGVVVGIEGANQLWLYTSLDDRPRRVSPPQQLYRSPPNSGAEALATLDDGRLVVITEGLERDDGYAAWVQTATPRWDSFTYRPAEGFRPTGAAKLPDGDLVVLERRFPLLSTRIVRVPADHIKKDALVTGEQLARLTGTVDNVEGIDAVLDVEGRTLIYVISDDNYHALLQTKLLMFELVGAP